MKHVVFLLDVSGSMTGKECAIVTATNNLLSCMQKELLDEQDNVTVKVYTFNTTRTLLLDKKLSECPAITEEQYKTNGGTALFDTLGQTLNEIPDGGTFVIATDGDDNESVEYKTDTIRTLIDVAKDKRNINFNFLAQGQEAFNCGTQIGLTQGRGTQAFRTKDVGDMGGEEFAMACCSSVRGTGSNKMQKTDDDAI